MIEYRVAVVKSGINSYDYFTKPALAEDRFERLKKYYKSVGISGKVSLQKRETTEWEDVATG